MVALKKQSFMERSKALEYFKECLEQDQPWKGKVLFLLDRLKAMEIQGQDSEDRKEIVLALFTEYETLIKNLSAEYSLPIVLKRKVREPIFEPRDYTQYAVLGFIDALQTYDEKNHGSFVDFVASKMKLAMDSARKLTRNIAPIAKLQFHADRNLDYLNPNWLEDLKASKVLTKTEYKLVVMKVKGEKIKTIAKYFQKSTPWVSKTYTRIISKLKIASKKNPLLFQKKET